MRYRPLEAARTAAESVRAASCTIAALQSHSIVVVIVWPTALVSRVGLFLGAYMRTVYSGLVDESFIGQTVTLFGWAHRGREGR